LTFDAEHEGGDLIIAAALPAGEPAIGTDGAECQAGERLPIIMRAATAAIAAELASCPSKYRRRGQCFIRSGHIGRGRRTGKGHGPSQNQKRLLHVLFSKGVRRPHRKVRSDLLSKSVSLGPL